MNVTVKPKSSHSSVFGILFITVVLVLLKVFKAIDWSWWGVTFPVWSTICIDVLVLYIRDQIVVLKGED